MRFFIFLLLFVSCQYQQEKVNGVSFVSSGKEVNLENITPVKKLNANYAAVMPFGFIESLGHSNLRFNEEWQWFGEREEGVKQYIEELQKQKIKVMLKPQIWVKDGLFTGKIKMNSESDWQQFEKRYSEFILTFAKVAQEKQIPLFCIGTELEFFVENRPGFWKSLINEVKKIYKGKLTYAANWDEFTKTVFWADLDFIGIDGYFPLTEEKTPTIDSLKLGWVKHKKIMKKYSDSLQKKILFTEFGYRSLDYAAAKPWEVDYNKTSVNLKAQVNATKVLFEELWKEEWFAGGFVWKWFIDYENSGGKNDSRFTPQNKPVENVIREYYLRHN
ncbi:glycoside hydrolase family 113 [Pseudofulvibacter geojedonensis]|uniref:Glycoside hydrolase n=1 Tax=Pseudofulvibacter geojedonensis TaxID=1123758 RepID=A0ABW3I1R0_9FLAO